MGDPPPNCNTLILFEGKTVYSKLTCEWGFRRAGRQTKEDDNPKKKILTITMDNVLYQQLEDLAAKRSKIESRYVSEQTIIREMLAKYLQKNREDLFENPRLEKLIGNEHV